MEPILKGNKQSYTRQELFELWMSFGQTSIHKSKCLEHEILASFEDEILEKFRTTIVKNISRLCDSLCKKWDEAKRTQSRFLKNNEIWLHGEVVLFSFDDKSSSSSRGRPSVPFEECSERTKRRRTQELRNTTDVNELTHAVCTSLRLEGKTDAAKLVDEALNTTPKRATKIRKAWINSASKATDKYSPEEALSLTIETKLTKHQYTKIRLQAKEKNSDLYPSYNRVREAKGDCYPNSDEIIVTDVLAEVKLQALLDHTARRIVLSQDEVFRSVTSNTQLNKELVLMLKWGCDGSTGHSEYKQLLPDGSTDSDMFISSVVPLQLVSKQEEGTKLILWSNPRPSSVRYCRPISIKYQKETVELALTEISNIKEQISDLLPLKVSVEDKEYLIKYEMIMTMIDGKICNSATSTSSAMTCYICKATPKEMNQLERINSKVVDPSSFEFGLSTLHAWIRFLECILHISYRLSFQKWQARKEDKDELAKRKAEVQKELRLKMGLLVDKVKPGGSGTTNDGNTARRFFQNPALVSDITGVDEQLIRNFGIILKTMSSGFRVNTDKFAAFTQNTAKLYVQQYPWYYKPVSVHKILIHGADIIKHAILPIGLLSEEAQECRNKDLKMCRRSHTRKMSRLKTNQDLLHVLLASSDPFISGLRTLPHKYCKPLASEVKTLLEEPKVTEGFGRNAENSSSDESSESEF